MNELSLRQTVEEFLQTHQLDDGQRLIVGVSGGADSLALLHGLVGFAREWVTVVHVDHGLRKDSAEDAHYVQQMCRAWKVPCIVARLSLDKDSEETARRERYRTLSTIVQEQNTIAILTAHHADDQVETVLMNFLRGAGVDGLSGMAVVSPVPYGVDDRQRLYRPILTLTRSDILAYCNHHNIQFVEDETNQDTRYFRNRVRHELLPFLESHAPQIRRRLLQLAEMSSADSDLLSTLASKTYHELVLQAGERWHELDLAKWRALSLGLRRRTLRFALQTLDEDMSDVGFGVIEEARNVAEIGVVGKQASLPNGWRLTVGYDRLLIGADDFVPQLDVPQIEGEATLAIPGEIALEDGWRLSAEIVPPQELRSLKEQSSSTCVFVPYFAGLTVRGRRIGERMQPFGTSGSAKLKRIMIDHKIPQRARDKWPLVVAEDQIVWVVGEVLGEIGRIQPESNRWIRLQLKRTTPQEFAP